MRLRVQNGLPCFVALVVLSIPLRADTGDVDGSSDYPDFPRQPGFAISDYDEDNPADFDFPVARPTPTDSDHVDLIHVKGHRYVIRYELAPGGPERSLLQTQQYYEKLADKNGFTLEKSAAVGDVNETFHRRNGTGDIWVYVEPEMTVNVVTVMESSPVSHEPSSAVAPASPTVPAVEDSLYTALVKNGRVVLDVTFPPGHSALDPSAQPMIDRVAAILKTHPELTLRIEGHTDATGSPADSRRLSAERAQAVRAQLIAAGIDKKRLVAVGLGGLVPVADDNTTEGREKNRRIELVVQREITP